VTRTVCQVVPSSNEDSNVTASTVALLVEPVGV